MIYPVDSVIHPLNNPGQDNKHRLEDECTDFSLKLILAGMELEKYRNDQEVSQSITFNSKNVVTKMEVTS